MKTGWMTVACLGLLAVASAAQAKIITFGFSGELFGGPGLPDGPVSYSGQYSFEDVQPNLSQNPDEGDYITSSVTLDVGTTHYESPLGFITVFKDPRLREDVYLVGATFGAGVLLLPIIYDNFNVFADLSLPLTPPPLTGRDTLFPAGIVLDGLLGFSGQLAGSLDSLTCLSCDNATPVPTPTTWLLTSVAAVSLLAFMGVRVRRLPARRDIHRSCR